MFPVSCAHSTSTSTSTATATATTTTPTSTAASFDLPGCFLSPTSVAHVRSPPATSADRARQVRHAADEEPGASGGGGGVPPPLAMRSPPSSVPAHRSHPPTSTSTITSDSEGGPSSLSHGQLCPEVCGETPRYYYNFPQLSNTRPSPPHATVTKAQFAEALDKFVGSEPANVDVAPEVLVVRMRELLDSLDALVEQLSLRVTNSLFDALSPKPCMSMLLFLLSDVSARSSPIITDIRKSFRYPYLVANILANGSMGIRDAFLSTPSLVTHLLSFLDGNVVLSFANEQLQPVPNSADRHTDPPPVYACDNQVIVGNVVQILVSYLETSPEALLRVFHARPSFIPCLVNLLHVGSVPKLLNTIIPDRCVDNATIMDSGNVSFDAPLTLALSVLSSATIYNSLAEAFVEAAQTVFDLVSDRADSDRREEVYKAEQVSFNAVEVFGTITRKTIRAVRMQRCPEEQYLNLFGNANTAVAIAQVLRIGIELLRGTDGVVLSTLNVGLRLTIDVLKFVEEDRERRVASVRGQPPPLSTLAFEKQIEPLLTSLMEILIDTVAGGSQYGQMRLEILELFMQCQAVCSERLVATLDGMRFGEVAMKVMFLNPRNSLLQHIMCRGVETALIADGRSELFARHWLLRSNLPTAIMTKWFEEDGDVKWHSLLSVQQSPVLSALMHMACCIEHWIAMQRSSGDAESATRTSQDTRRRGDGVVREFLSEETIRSFENFCERTVHPIMHTENAYLGGPKPRRRPTQTPNSSNGRSFGRFGQTSGSMLRRTGSGGAPATATRRAHLVRSPCAHRFGYVEPVTPSNTLRSRFDNLFLEDDADDDDGFGVALDRPFTSIFSDR